MSLIGDQDTIKKLKDRLDEFGEFGMLFYYSLAEEKIKRKEVFQMFFSTDDEKSSFMYGKMMRQINVDDVEISFCKYSECYPNEENMSLKKYKKYLNLVYTEKLLKDFLVEESTSKEKVYLNTYFYLITLQLQ